MNNQYKYLAFISYKREDEKWAKWLHHKLENYRIPVEIRKNNPEVPDKLYPIFKDTTDLNGGYLSKELQKNLESSRFLIVICSRLSAKSFWVNEEVEYFIKLGRSEYILPFVVDGEPFSMHKENECYPEALRMLKGDYEILGINVIDNGKESAAFKIISRILGVRFDVIWNRHEREISKRKKILFSALALIIILLSTVSSKFYTLSSRLAQDNAILIQLNETISKQKDSIQAQRDSIKYANEKTLQENLNFRIEQANRYIYGNQPFSAIVSLKDISYTYHQIRDEQKGRMELLYRAAHECIPKNTIISSINSYSEESIIEKSSNHEIETFEHMDMLSYDKKYKASLDAEDTLWVSNVDTGDIIFSLFNDASYFSCYAGQGKILGFSDDNRFILVSGGSRTQGGLSLVDVTNQQHHILSTWYNYDTFKENQNYYTNGELYSNSLLLMYGTAGMKILSLPDLKEIINLPDIFDECHFSEDGKNIVIKYGKCQAEISIDSKSECKYYINNDDIVWDISYSPRDHLAIGTENGIVIWDIRKRKKIAHYLHNNPIISLEYSNNGNMLAASTPYNDIYFIDAITGIDITPDINLNPHSGLNSTSTFQFSPNNNYIAIRNDFNMIYSFKDNKILYRGFSDDDMLFIKDSLLILNGETHVIRRDSVYKVDVSNNQAEVFARPDNISYKLQENLKWHSNHNTFIYTNTDSTVHCIVYPDNIISVLTFDKDITTKTLFDYEIIPL